ncbi:hypothetical protein C2E23DRAFT_893252 [Lenzites betulinus]|nr:hypothetical protein C2E23DRAFT_893252 [Lenzites betulinus]
MLYHLVRAILASFLPLLPVLFGTGKLDDWTRFLATTFIPHHLPPPTNISIEPTDLAHGLDYSLTAETLSPIALHQATVHPCYQAFWTIAEVLSPVFASLSYKPVVLDLLIPLAFITLWFTPPTSWLRNRAGASRQNDLPTLKDACEGSPAALTDIKTLIDDVLCFSPPPGRSLLSPGPSLSDLASEASATEDLVRRAFPLYEEEGIFHATPSFEDFQRSRSLSDIAEDSIASDSDVDAMDAPQPLDEMQQNVTPLPPSSLSFQHFSHTSTPSSSSELETVSMSSEQVYEDHPLSTTHSETEYVVIEKLGKSVDNVPVSPINASPAVLQSSPTLTPSDIKLFEATPPISEHMDHSLYQTRSQAECLAPEGLDAPVNDTQTASTMPVVSLPRRQSSILLAQTRMPAEEAGLFQPTPSFEHLPSSRSLSNIAGDSIVSDSNVDALETSQTLHEMQESVTPPLRSSFSFQLLSQTLPLNGTSDLEAASPASEQVDPSLSTECLATENLEGPVDSISAQSLIVSPTLLHSSPTLTPSDIKVFGTISPISEQTDHTLSMSPTHSQAECLAIENLNAHVEITLDSPPIVCATSPVLAILPTRTEDTQAASTKPTASRSRRPSSSGMPGQHVHLTTEGIEHAASRLYDDASTERTAKDERRRVDEIFEDTVDLFSEDKLGFPSRFLQFVIDAVCISRGAPRPWTVLRRERERSASGPSGLQRDIIDGALNPPLASGLQCRRAVFEVGRSRGGNAAAPTSMVSLHASQKSPVPPTQPPCAEMGAEISCQQRTPSEAPVAPTPSAACSKSTLPLSYAAVAAIPPPIAALRARAATEQPSGTVSSGTGRRTQGAEDMPFSTPSASRAATGPRRVHTVLASLITPVPQYDPAAAPSPSSSAEKVSWGRRVRGKAPEGSWRVNCTSESDDWRARRVPTHQDRAPKDGFSVEPPPFPAAFDKGHPPVHSSILAISARTQLRDLAEQAKERGDIVDSPCASGAASPSVVFDMEPPADVVSDVPSNDARLRPAPAAFLEWESDEDDSEDDESGKSTNGGSCDSVSDACEERSEYAASDQGDDKYLCDDMETDDPDRTCRPADDESGDDEVLLFAHQRSARKTHNSPELELSSNAASLASIRTFLTASCSTVCEDADLLDDASMVVNSPGTASECSVSQQPQRDPSGFSGGAMVLSGGPLRTFDGFDSRARIQQLGGLSPPLGHCASSGGVEQRSWILKSLSHNMSASLAGPSAGFAPGFAPGSGLSDGCSVSGLHARTGLLAASDDFSGDYSEGSSHAGTRSYAEVANWGFQGASPSEAVSLAPYAGRAELGNVLLLPATEEPTPRPRRRLITAPAGPLSSTQAVALEGKFEDVFKGFRKTRKASGKAKQAPRSSTREHAEPTVILDMVFERSQAIPGEPSKQRRVVRSLLRLPVMMDTLGKQPTTGNWHSGSAHASHA